MIISFVEMTVCAAHQDDSSNQPICSNAVVDLVTDEEQVSLVCRNKEGTCLKVDLSCKENCDFARQRLNEIIVTCSTDGDSFESYRLKCQNQSERDRLFAELNATRRRSVEKEVCLFDRRTDDASASQYFQFYGYLSQQQNMMQDFIRTSTYQKAILENFEDFSGKVVLDVGAGSGILSFFAMQAGASKVYAIEASSIAAHADTLVKSNGYADRIKVMCGKVEELDLPEKVDVIISEPMGYMLFNERMLETYIHAKKWLKPDGKMFPTQGILFISPFSDEGLFMEQMSKCNFWTQTSFYAVDLSSLRNEAVSEYFRQPVVDNFDVRVCLSKPVKYEVNFLSAAEIDLQDMRIPLEFKMQTTAVVHGLAFWFDVLFEGSQLQVWLSTSPTQPLTHWYQVRCLLPTPILVPHDQTIKGYVHFKSNTKQSYEIDIELEVGGIKSQNSLDLKNPFFRYTGQVIPPPPPGNLRECPTDQYYNALSSQPAIAYTGQQATPYQDEAQQQQNYYPSGQGDFASYYGMPAQHSAPPMNDFKSSANNNNCCISNDGSGFYYGRIDDEYQQINDDNYQISSNNEQLHRSKADEITTEGTYQTHQENPKQQRTI